MKKSNEILENIIEDIKQSVAKFYKDTERIEKIKMKEDLYKILSDNTGQPYEKIWHDADRDFWLNAQESLDYGLVDSIITKKS